MIRRNRKFITIALALAGMGIMIFYSSCTGSCDYLAGNFLGIDLKYVGIGFMAALIMVALLNFTLMVRIMLATALGGEVYLIGYQISVDTYCYYCLAFALLILAAFLINYQPVDALRGWRKFVHSADNEKGDALRKQEESIMRRQDVLHPASEIKDDTEHSSLKRILIVIFILLGFILLWWGFSGSNNLVFAEEMYPSFGKGNVEVRMYSNYFCGPCFRLKPQIEPLLDTLVKRNRIRLLFIDMPFDKKSWEYNRYYLYAVREDPSFENALRFRVVLFEAADAGIKTEKDLQLYLQRLGREPTASDISSELRAARQYIRDDGITSTPTVVIEKDGTTHVYKGIERIIEALEAIDD
jgi:thiol:disulfide interchange protein DsbA